MSKRILIMAGGTGGHIFPGLAVADELRAQGWQVDWLGTATRMEAQLVPSRGYPIHFLDIAGLRGNGVAGWLQAPLRLMKAVRQAQQLIAKLQPDVVLGMGGFAAGPGGVAARLAGIPLLIHEQNAVAGMTNRYLAKLATQTMAAFADALPQAQVVGNPVRSDICQLTPYQPTAGVRRLLVVGGSLGADIFNQLIPQVLPQLPAYWQVRHQCGKNRSAAVQAAYADHPAAQASDFIDDMASAYQQADLIICRAGALTVSEIAAAGRAAIFVPYPHAVDDHQSKNAQVLVQAGAALCIPQSQLTAELLAQTITQLDNDEQLLQMALAARGQAITDAAQRVARACMQLAKGTE